MKKPSPPRPRGFHSRVHLAEHVCDHVLTRPEAHDWTLLLPPDRPPMSEFRRIAGNDKELLELARSLFLDPPSDDGNSLTSAYVHALLQAIADAIRMGFWWSEQSGKYVNWVGLGLSGITVIWDHAVIQSGYLPGSARFPPRGPKQPRSQNPLPRRNLAQRLGRFPPNDQTSRFRLFRTGLFNVKFAYQKAYSNYKRNQQPFQAGSDVFVSDPPTIEQWQKWVQERPR